MGDHSREEHASTVIADRLAIEPGDPVALTTAAIPPRPAERSSAAAHSRRPRSSSTPCALSSRNRSPIARSSTTTPQFYITPSGPFTNYVVSPNAQIDAVAAQRFLRQAVINLASHLSLTLPRIVAEASGERDPSPKAQTHRARGHL
jgi:hypothetical protein